MCETSCFKEKRHISGHLRCDKLRIDQFFTNIGNILGYLFTFLPVAHSDTSEFFSHPER